MTGVLFHMFKAVRKFSQFVDDGGSVRWGGFHSGGCDGNGRAHPRRGGQSTPIFVRKRKGVLNSLGEPFPLTTDFLCDHRVGKWHHAVQFQ